MNPEDKRQLDSCHELLEAWVNHEFEDSDFAMHELLSVLRLGKHFPEEAQFTIDACKRRLNQ